MECPLEQLCKLSYHLSLSLSSLSLSLSSLSLSSLSLSLFRKELLDVLERDVLTLKEKVKRLVGACRYHQLMDNNAPLQFNQRTATILQNIEEQRTIHSPDPLMVMRERERELKITLLLTTYLYISVQCTQHTCVYPSVSSDLLDLMYLEMLYMCFLL